MKTDPAIVRANVQRELLNQLAWQDARWGEQNHPPLYWLGIITEELGELAKDLIEAPSLAPGEQIPSGVYVEALHLAATVSAFLEYLERCRAQ